MVEMLLVLCLLIWSPILLHHVTLRGPQILVIWLFIAPIATNIVHGRISNPFFRTSISQDSSAPSHKSHKKQNTYGYHAKNVRLEELLEPNRIIFATFLIAFFLVSIVKRKQSISLDWAELWMGAFSLVAIANVLFLSSRLEANLRAVTDAFIIPFTGYYVARRLIISEERFLQLARGIGYTGFYLIIICLIERLVVHQGLMYRLSGPFEGGAVLHVVVATAFFVVLIETIRRWALPRQKPVFLWCVQRIVLFLAPCIILLTWSRGNWVGFLGGLWIVFFLGRRLINVSRKLAVIGLILILGQVIAIGTLSNIPGEDVEQRLENSQTVAWRFASWNRAWQFGEGHRLFGVGFNNLRNELNNGNFTVHNSVISLFVEFGFIGLFLYVAIVVSIIRGGLNLYRVGSHSWDRWRGIMIIAVMAEYLLPALFFETIYSTELSHIYVYVLVGATVGLYGYKQSMLRSNFGLKEERLPLQGAPS
jgi:O-antigen ligase